MDVLKETPPVAQILEAVYRIDLAPVEWLHSIRAALGNQEGSGAALVRSCAPTGEVVALSADAVFEEIMSKVFASGPDGEVLTPMALPRLLVGTHSEYYEVSEEFVRAYADARAEDSWAICALSPGGTGFCYNHLLPRRARMTPRARRYWSAVGGHLAASVRLRLALESPTEAVLAPDGKLLHAEGGARAPGHRQTLRAAARTIDRARTAKADPLTAIESWTALVDGRWSLVDQFDSDGRHFLIARVNEPTVEGHPQLSDRERQVVAFAALGRSNKQIAYELGIDATSVAGYLKRAAKKLHVKTRTEIIAHTLSSMIR